MAKPKKKKEPKLKRLPKLKEKELKEKLKTAKIVFAPTTKLEKVWRVADDFVEHCIGVKSFLISDLSSIFDFESDPIKVKKIFEKASKRYGVGEIVPKSSLIVDIAKALIDQHRKDLKK